MKSPVLSSSKISTALRGAWWPGRHLLASDGRGAKEDYSPLAKINRSFGQPGRLSCTPSAAATKCLSGIFSPSIPLGFGPLKRNMSEFDLSSQNQQYSQTPSPQSLCAQLSSGTLKCHRSPFVREERWGWSHLALPRRSQHAPLASQPC